MERHRGTLRARRSRLRTAAAVLLALGGTALGFTGEGARPAPRRPRTASAAEATPEVAPGAGAAAEGDAAKSAKIPFKELQVGQTLDGAVVNRWRTVGCLVDVGAEKTGLLEVGEFRDGFPREGNAFRRGDKVQVRVLDVTDGKLFLTMRSGDLTRPPRRRTDPPDVEAFAGVSPEAWLEGQVDALTTWGAFVAVTPPSGGKPASGMVHKSRFSDGFPDDASKAVRGGKVRVRVLAVDAEKGKLELSMREGGELVF
mmetsp:Transcript_122477/g.357626  ORF Transcript_122477/g.357626 Transcript_122477/m.357626 type:complete len:256 (-) Transcript_122477:9-776(-)